MALRGPLIGKNFKAWLLAAFLLGIVLFGIWVSAVKLESQKPIINLQSIPEALPADSVISGNVSDEKSGIKKIWIQLIKDGKEIVLLEKEFASPGLMGQSLQRSAPFSISLNTKQMGISDGRARLVFTAWDYSWQNWWNGNKASLEKDIVFDTKTPVISVLSGQHYINRGGAGFLIYQLSEPCVTSGVYSGEDFFPGHAGYFQNTNIYLAFFAVRADQDPVAPVYVKAVDMAGNSSAAHFYYRILNKSFSKETITISDAFLNSKFLEFQSTEGWPGNASTSDKFLFINKDLRKRNNERILGSGKGTDAQFYWDGSFLRMPNSAPMSGYADHRLYSYNGNIIDEADHMGIDLASLPNAEVPAANSGKIAFAEYIGIYGNCVGIDHGFGLFSIYGHLSQLLVHPGEKVSKGDLIGRTGTTGWAGGDHLHYGMFIDHVFVNPTEWWDSSWIKNNITDKIKSISESKN